jgi:preprotein translocase SecE subunit
MKTFFTYLKNVRGEFAHVVWPTRRQAIQHTILLILISAALGAFIALLDYFFTGIVGQIVS